MPTQTRMTAPTSAHPLSGLRSRAAALTGTALALVLGSALTSGTLLVIAAAAQASDAGENARYWATVVMVLLGTATTVACFVSVFVVASTFALNVALRRRELALLRLSGATPGQVRRSVLAEALVTGALAAALGAALGPITAPVLTGLIDRSGLVAGGFPVPYAVWPQAVSFGLGLAVALTGAWAASRRAGRISPLEALREASIDRKPMTRSRWTGGLAFLAIGLWQVAHAPSTSSDSALTDTTLVAACLITAVALLAPVIVPPLLRAACLPLARGRGANGMLARENAGAAVQRTAATAAPALVTVGLAAALAGALGTVSAAQLGDVRHLVRADAVVSAPGDGSVPEAAVDAAAAIDGATVSAQSRGEVYLSKPDGDERRAAIGIDARTWPRAIAVNILQGDLGGLSWPDTMAVAQQEAGDPAMSVGKAIPVRFPDGTTRRLEVVAVVRQVSEALPIPSVLLDRDLLRAHDQRARTEVAYVSGADVPEVRAAIAGTGARTGNAADYAEALHGTARDSNNVLLALVGGMSLAYTFIALANTLVMTTADRRREFAMLRMAGATRGQIVRLAAYEAAAAVLVGALLGITVALLTLRSLASALSENFVTISPVMPWALTAAATGACLAAAAATAALTATYTLGWPRQPRMPRS
ncbi:hypothetical protein GCM10009555_105370 [Acrocarpospora macrocephala]|uniref:ABC transporter permease n=1 Tax=Acrocarpospora macrocephala TaxID=150177 RepID=A0A5M3X620_9ACTN|nr:FtsX-like permease family protein [Acrocarpospora macrocephala]GES13608.1 ABC transporter permease [Acrocarpospora macrocephala]